MKAQGGRLKAEGIGNLSQQRIDDEYYKPVTSIQHNVRYKMYDVRQVTNNL
ncbi:MAG: hypothetical protein QM594_21435 [Niabella sp.]